MTTKTASGARPAWCLRFANGALQGRTLALKAGLNVLGAGAEADVLLPVSAVLPQHLLLEAGALAVTVRRCGDAPVALNGTRLDAARRSLVAGDVLTVGDIDLELDMADAAGSTHDPLLAAGAAQAAPVPPRDAGAAMGRGVRSVLAVAGLVIAASLLVIATTRHDSPADEPVTRASLAAVQQVLHDYPETHAVAEGARISVRGYVETRERQAALRRALGLLGAGIDLGVASADDLLEQARRFVGEPAVTFSYAGQGRLVAAGVVEDDAVRRQLRLLSEDLYPVALVADKVTVQPKSARPRPADLPPPAPAWKELLPARVVGISRDAQGVKHLQLADGSRYYEGATLKSGAELRRIDADSLVVAGAAAAPVAESE